MQSIYGQNRFENGLRALEKSDLDEKNSKLVLDFCDESRSQGLSKGRIVKYIYYMIKLGTWLGRDFESAQEADIKALIREIEESGYVDFSKAEMKIVLKKFYRWLRKADDYPDEVGWIRPRGKKISKVKLPEEILTEEEIMAMVQAAHERRDRALIATLYESGCRIGELMMLRIRHISFDTYGAQIVVDGKTGPRRVRIISSVPYLRDWLNSHPFHRNPDSFVFTTSSGKLLSYGRVASILKQTATKAGIRKRVFPHLFRHSRATYLANHLTEAQMKEVFGWVQASDMASIYVHLSGRDVDNALLKICGISKPDAPEESQLKPKLCGRCKAKNQFTNLYCSKCAFPLEEETRLKAIKEETEMNKADNILNEMLRDRGFQEAFNRRLQQVTGSTR